MILCEFQVYNRVIQLYIYLCLGLPAGSVVKNLPAMQESWVRSLGQEDPWKRVWKPTPILLPIESHRGAQQTAVHSHTESDMIEATKRQQQHMCICTFSNYLST